VTVHWLTVSDKTAPFIVTSLHKNEADVLRRLRAGWDPHGEYADVSDDDLVQTLIDEEGLEIYMGDEVTPDFNAYGAKMVLDQLLQGLRSSAAELEGRAKRLREFAEAIKDEAETKGLESFLHTSLATNVARELGDSTRYQAPHTSFAHYIDCAVTLVHGRP
jgi:hypothetical protein